MDRTDFEAPATSARTQAGPGNPPLVPVPKGGNRRTFAGILTYEPINTPPEIPRVRREDAGDERRRGAA